MSLEFFMMVRLQVSANVYWQFLGNTFKNTTCTCLHRVKYNLFQLISCWGNFREAALQRCSWPYSGWAFPGLLTDGGWTKKASLPKICHTYPTMMKPSTVIPYLKKIQKIYQSRDTPPEFCWHQHFFTGNQQILLYQEIQI